MTELSQGRERRVCAGFLVRLGVLAALVIAPVDASGAAPTTRPAVRPTTRPKTLTPSVAMPRTTADLRSLERRVKTVVEKAQPAVVGILARGTQGSGVVVSKDGYVLTAGHVASVPNVPVDVVFPDGKRARGVTLGMNLDIDSGMVKITDEGKFPFVEMGDSRSLKPGAWVVAMGHPGGYRKERTPPVRLGQVLEASATTLRTNCTLMSGDSGGPLFDLDGRVVGIHSRIGEFTYFNMHVPVETYHETWDLLAGADRWGGRFGPRDLPHEAPVLGVELVETDPKRAEVSLVIPGTAAYSAGLAQHDVIVKYNGQPITSHDKLKVLIARSKVGEEVTIEVLRGGKSKTIKARLGARG